MAPQTASTLPTEVWSDILELAYVHDFPACHTTQFAPAQYPVPMARVSRYFRHLALNLPKLWTCLHITPIGRHPHRDQGSVVHEQLTRSRNLPLTILFACHSASTSPDSWMSVPTFFNSDEGRHFSGCWDLILPHSKRWRRLAFYAKFPYFLDHFLLNDVIDANLPMPILEDLEVFCGTVEEPEGQLAETVPYLDIPELVLPQLRSLRGGGMQWRLSQPSVNVPVTELVLTRVSRPWQALHFFELLRSVSATLVTLVMVDVSTQGLVPSIQLGRLQNLALEKIRIDVRVGDGRRTVPAVRAFLDGAPGLRKLELNDVEFAFALRHERSYSSVQTLELRFIGKANYMFESRFPHVRRLSIPSEDSYDLLRNLLEGAKSMAKRKHIPLLPYLEELSLQGTETDASEFVACLDAFIDFRAKMGVPLKALHLCDGLRALTGLLSYEYLLNLNRLLHLTVTVSPDEHKAKEERIVRWDAALNKPVLPHWI